MAGAGLTWRGRRQDSKVLEVADPILRIISYIRDEVLLVYFGYRKRLYVDALGRIS